MRWCSHDRSYPIMGWHSGFRYQPNVMAYYPARFHFQDLVWAALIGFCLGVLIFKVPQNKIEWDSRNVVVAGVKE